MDEMNATKPESISEQVMRSIAPKVAALAVDVPEAAAMLRVCPMTIRREIQRGSLRAFRVGRLLRIRVAELERYASALEKVS